MELLPARLQAVLHRCWWLQRALLWTWESSRGHRRWWNHPCALFLDLEGRRCLSALRGTVLGTWAPPGCLLGRADPEWEPPGRDSLSDRLNDPFFRGIKCCSVVAGTSLCVQRSDWAWQDLGGWRRGLLFTRARLTAGPGALFPICFHRWESPVFKSGLRKEREGDKGSPGFSHSRARWGHI